MNKFLHPITDWVSTKRGMWITIIAWLVLMVGISAGPMLSEYKVTNFQSLPDDAASIIAQQKVDEYFPNDGGTPGILVFTNEQGDIDVEEVKTILAAIAVEKIEGIDEIVDIASLAQTAVESFISEDGTTMMVPMMLEADLGS
ncbi:MAG: MMPL family transporter, partial [Caryophanon sp.]|nr:MMPL family transporter [Caryophanon sp.]